jgi:hypothetical protein
MLPLLGCAVRIIVLLLGLFSTTATAQTNVTDSILFFYSPVLDQCEWGPSNSFQATNNTVNGGVCGYIPAKNRLYACPAPDPYVYFTLRCLQYHEDPLSSACRNR